MTQEELGRLLGVTGVTIMRYEKGQREPSLDQLQKLGKLLKVEPSYLAGWSAGQTLSAMRQAQGITQEEMTRQAQLSPGELERYESGNDIIPAKVLAKILSVLGHSAEDSELYQRLTKAEDALEQAYSEREEALYEVLETKLEMLLLTLNETGQKTALQRMVELAQIPDYQNKYFTAEERSAILQECKE